jgi:hypothetical protein
MKLWPKWLGCRSVASKDALWFVFLVLRGPIGRCREGGAAAGRVMRARRGRWLRWRDGSRHVPNLGSYSPSLSLWSNYQRSLPRMTAEVVVPYAVLIQYSTGCYTRVRRAVGTHSSVPNGVGTHSSAAIVSGQPALQSWLRMRMCRRASNKRERTRRSSHLARLACLRAVLPSEMRKARREREKRRALR